MNISDTSYNLNISSNNIGTGADMKGMAPQVSAGGNVTANAQISMAKEGQIFTGQILDITNDRVSIMLDNNKTLLAHMGEALNMNIGDTLTFMIKENNGANVLIKPFGDGTQSMKDNAIFKSLDFNNISPTAKNYQIAESLMNNNMPLDKASMQKVMQQSYKYPDASIDNLVSMNKLGLPVNSETLAQYDSYMTNTHQLMENVNNLSDSIIQFNKDSVNNILNNMGQTGEAAINSILENNSTLLSTLSDSGDMANINISELIIASGELTEGTIQGNISQGEVLTEVANGTGISEEISSSAARLGINEETLNNLAKELGKAGIAPEIINSVINKSETPMQLLNNINSLLSNGEALKPDSKEIKDLMLSEDYNKTLSEAIKDKFSLNPKEMKYPSELDDLYKSMYEKTDKLMQAFSSGANGGGDAMNQAAKSMQERIDFMQNLNNMFAYAQIPVKMENNQMNSDLFVYMNKRTMKDSKEEVSALLHLDMEHLGATDVHVSLHGTNVHTRFYVEDEISAKIIDEHMTMLEKSINESGFQLTNEVITREPTLATSDKNMVVSEMLGNDMEKSVKRYSFDVRM